MNKKMACDLIKLVLESDNSNDNKMSLITDIVTSIDSEKEIQYVPYYPQQPAGTYPLPVVNPVWYAHGTGQPLINPFQVTCEARPKSTVDEIMHHHV